jgi:V/A-type H+-transporting ATPase subunit D
MQLARQGMDLLKRKRDALLVEFMDTVDETMRLARELESNTAEAQYALTIARAVDGLVAVHSAAMASRGAITVEVSGIKIMGVPVPVLTKADSTIRGPLARGYSVVGISSRVDHTAERFEVMLEGVVEYAGRETRLRRVGEEIQKTSRRVNALEQVTLPTLSEQVNYIRQTLDERAREDLFRLKKVKKKIERKKSARN